MLDCPNVAIEFKCSIKIYKLRRKNQITSLRQDEIVNIHVSCNS
jgi:hypothetical protein